MLLAFLVVMQTLTHFILEAVNSELMNKPWYARPIFVLPWAIISFLIVVLGSNAVCSPDGMPSLVVPGLIALLSIPHGRLLVAMIAEKGGGLYGIGEHRDKPIKSTATAMSLILQERYEDADEAFVQEIGDEPHGPLPENAPIRLEYGKFLSDRGKTARAVAEWETAIQGDLDASQCAEAALGAADLLQHQMKDHNRSLRILRAAINRYPDARSMEALRRRLRQSPRPE